jgi:hypothetical protein
MHRGVNDLRVFVALRACRKFFSAQRAKFTVHFLLVWHDPPPRNCICAVSLHFFWPAHEYIKERILQRGVT